jgi:nitroreductase
MAGPVFEPLADYREYEPPEMAKRAAEFYAELRRRRTVREFSDRPVPLDVIEDCVRAAGTAPNGANLQPWHFVVVTDPVVKQRIRVAAEEAEREFYRHRAPKEWLAALAPLGTDEHTP